MTQKRIHAIVHGRVQGVFFRDYTRKKARELSLSGWVRNLPDGRVEAWLQGDAEVVSNMVTWCYDGPQWARVDDIAGEDVTPDDSFSSFRVRY